jgi:hypothetical protein
MKATLEVHDTLFRKEKSTGLMGVTVRSGMRGAAA